MKKKTLLMIVLTILATIVVYFVTSKQNASLVGSTFIQQITRPQPSPNSTPVSTPNAPKTFKFDSSTDLKAELEKVNPQVLDADFE